jgi:hypothetical protein
VSLPTGEALPARPWDTAPISLQLALARGHRWLTLLTTGEVQSLGEIAAREGVDSSYVSRTVNLTTIAPDNVAASNPGPSLLQPINRRQSPRPFGVPQFIESGSRRRGRTQAYGAVSNAHTGMASGGSVPAAALRRRPCHRLNYAR